MSRCAKGALSVRRTERRFMVMLFATAVAAYSGRGLADADGHDHGAAATCATYEFGGIYAVPVGSTYKLPRPPTPMERTRRRH